MANESGGFVKLGPFSSLLCSSLLFSSGLNAVEPSEVEAEQALRGLDESGAFELLRGSGDTVRGVLGRFDVGLDERTSQDPARVIEALQTFINGHSELYRLGSVDLRVREIQPITGDTHVVRIDQYVGGLRVDGKDLSAAFWVDGALQSLNGRMINDQIVERTMSSDDALRSFTELGMLSSPDGFVFNGLAYVREQDLLEEVYVDSSAGSGWKLVTPDGEAVLDQATNVLVSANTHLEHVTGPCNVRRFDMPRSSGRATAFTETSATITEQVTCEASDFFGTCTWELRREPFGFQHGIARVTDFDGGELSVVQSCSSAAVPQFANNTMPDMIREQGAFYVQNQMRFFTDQNVWSQVAQDRDANVRITLDNPNVATAAFNPFTTDIDCNQAAATPVGVRNACAQDVLAHEYGHYVVWSYGDASNVCDPGDDEGDTFDETAANAFGLLFYLDDDESLAHYQAMSGFALGNGPAAHTTPGSRLSAIPSCPANLAADGQPFLQAWWEVLWNRNCNTETCTGTMAFGNTIWPGLNQEQVMTRAGGALGSALSVLPAALTHQDVRAQMRLRINTESGAATAERFQRVFSHHGLTCPGCCTGC